MTLTQVPERISPFEPASDAVQMSRYPVTRFDAEDDEHDEHEQQQDDEQFVAERRSFTVRVLATDPDAKADATLACLIFGVGFLMPPLWILGVLKCGRYAAIRSHAPQHRSRFPVLIA